ncbi:MAG: NAD(P)H-dependent oxidoreductase subunit E [Actinomycetota bacterium]|nr:NAD(P)H-dependent oxidoreductase subunit E [Actinomycetota bacterium]
MTLEVLEGSRLDEARAIISKYPNKHSAMLPLLQLVQSVEGYVTEAGMRDVAQLLDVTPAHVLSSASFYTMLKKRPQGTYLISVCRNLSCTHMGGRKVMTAFEERLGIAAGETTADGKFTLEAAECLATCDGAPSLQVNYEDFYKVTPDEARELVDRLERGDQVTSVRGEVVKTSREIAHETALAGARLPGTAGDHTARLLGGETPRPDSAPGFRPRPETGDMDG